MGYFITKLKLQVKVSVEKYGKGFLKLIARGGGGGGTFLYMYISQKIWWPCT